MWTLCHRISVVACFLGAYSVHKIQIYHVWSHMRLAWSGQCILRVARDAPITDSSSTNGTSSFTRFASFLTNTGLFLWGSKGTNDWFNVFNRGRAKDNYLFLNQHYVYSTVSCTLHAIIYGTKTIRYTKNRYETMVATMMLLSKQPIRYPELGYIVPLLAIVRSYRD